MSRLATSFVLGYHGCDADLAAQVVTSAKTLLPSDNDHDWPGSGIYFWESDPERAFEWARDRCMGDKPKFSKPGVVGAVIDLQNCLDLTSRVDLELVRQAHSDMKAAFALAGVAMPRNIPARRLRAEDVHLRKLDNAVVNFLHNKLAAESNDLDTVRDPFIEGEPIYDSAKFHEKTHIQISVRNHACIKGYFCPPGLAPDDIAKRQSKALP